MGRLPPESLKPFATALARAIWSGNAELVRSLNKELTHRLPSIAEEQRADASLPQPQEFDRIGIWGRTPGDVASPYRRLDRYRPDWRLWADVDEIRPDTRGRKIVWLGESAARGYFYDPVFAPALVLQNLLREAPGLGDIEVVDLARSNIDPAGVIALAEESVRFKPALMVVFAGNNWTMSKEYGRETRRRLIDALAAQGYRGYIDVIDLWRAQRTEAALDRLAAAAAKAAIPMIVVVPETNLLDWREDASPLVPFLAGDRNPRWNDVARDAKAAFDGGRTVEAARLAEALIELDQGTSPVGLTILAHCRLAAGRITEACALLETARDTVRALPIDLSPGCARQIQTGLRSGCEKHGLHIVDLPGLIRERLDGGLPDRRMFLDYCHLTSDGIRLMVAAVAARAVSLLTGRAADLNDAVGRLGPTPDVEAHAHFMAAIHCARWRQSGELVDYHCAEAVRHSPGVTERMAAYLNAFSRSGPPWLGQSFTRLAGERHQPTYRYFAEVSPFAEEKGQHELLIDAMKRIVGDRPASARPIDAHIVAVDSACAVDLLSPRHLATGGVHSTSCALRPTDYFEAYEPASRFVLRLDAPRTFRLELTWRTPFAGPDGQILILLDGAQAAALPTFAKWHSVSLPSLVLDSGRHELTIIWPHTGDAGAKRLAESLSQLRRGVLPNPLVEYGHCWRFRLVP
jgi:hypothetical protein